MLQHFFFFQAEDGIRDVAVTGVQTCALPIFSRVLAESAKEAGAVIRTEAEVAEIRIKDGAVAGVVLKDGEEIAVEAVVSGGDPKRTFFHLIDPSQLDSVFVNRMKNFPAKGNVGKRSEERRVGR